MPGYGLPETTKGLLPWRWAEQRLKKSHNYWISTARPDGTPHAMVIWGLWLDNAFYFSTGTKTRKGRNLAHKPYCVIGTENAAEAIQAIVDSSPEVAGEAGLRITARPQGEQEKLELMIAGIPAEDDEVVEEHGAHVFLDPGAVSYLEDKVLDARVEGEQVGFALLEQE